MAIAVRSLYNDLADAVGAGTGNARFENAFPRAVNRALSELAVSVDAATKYATIASNDGVINELNQSYEYIVYIGTLYWLVRAGWRPSSDPKLAAVIFEDTRKAWTEARADLKQDLDNISQATDTNDVTKLGSVVS